MLKVRRMLAKCLFEFEMTDEVRTSERNLEKLVETEIRRLETEGDNARFFDHRREWARTDFENGGVPSAPWRDLLAEMHRRAGAAGWGRVVLPGGRGGEEASPLLLAALWGELGLICVGFPDPLGQESSFASNKPPTLP